MRWVWPWAVLGVVACASPPPPPVVQPLYKDGVLQRALTPKDAERHLRQAVPDFEVCYKRERLNLAERVSSYVFKVRVPTDGTPVKVEVVKETVPDQVVLRSCLVEAIQRVKFPAHLGDPITMNVPLEGG